MSNSELIDEIRKSQDYAIELRKQGYGCGQCVLMTLSQKLGLDERQAAKMAAAFGSGFAGTGGLCGSISILGIAEGLLIDACEPADKLKAMRNTKEFIVRFETVNGGRSLCRDLKGKSDAKSCPELIKDGLEIFLNAHPELVGS